MDQAILLPEQDTNRRERACRIISMLSFEKAWEVIVRPYIERRSNSANARLWLLHTKAGQITGYSPEEMHEEALCRHFGYVEKTMPTGWIKRIPLKRSSQRDKKEFGEFMEATEAWYITDLGVWLE